MTVVELREKAKALGIKNVKKYKKDELLNMIEKIEKLMKKLCLIPL